MSVKWSGTHIDSGILRKNEFREKKEELFVFGYSCKLFRDDERAQQIDQGKHLIPWMGDETLKIDRYDARGALHDITTFEAPPGGFDWRVELSRGEQDVEQLCDEERYRALHTDEDEEEMYKEEELKRLHAAGYGQVGFNYEAPAEPAPPPTLEPDEAFQPNQALVDMLPTDVTLPESVKLNAIIEKTAKFIASQGVQMEILIKAKQRDNPQFKFLNRESELNPYYTALIALIKAGKWPEKEVQVVDEQKPPETEEYLHPSLASTVIELAPSIPSIQYKPSADCDYRLLVSRMRGEEPPGAGEDSGAPGEEPPAPGEDPPPGTRPLPPRPVAEISRAPVMYNTAQATAPSIPPVQSQETPAYHQQYAAYYHQYMAQTQAQQAQAQAKLANSPPKTLKSTGLSLMKNYNTDSDTDESDFDDSSSTDSKEKPTIAIPPDDVQAVIDKMAAYVARNGDEFADIVRAKNDIRFTFLDPDNVYHPYYKQLMQSKRGINVNGKEKSKKSSVPVSFSIKKLKEPDPILPKPALPYESSSDEDSDKQTEKYTEKNEDPVPRTPQIVNILPPIVVYKMEGQLTYNLPIVKALETVQPMPIPKTEVKQVKEAVPPPPPVISEKVPEVARRQEKKEIIEKNKEVGTQELIRSPHRSKRKHSGRKEYTSKSESRERRSDPVKRSADREKRRERQHDRDRDRDRDREKKRKNKELETEIISLEDNSDDLIDLTGEHSDTKVECETEAERAKQLERRRRAAEFLKCVGVDPSAAALPTTSLASAMVDTLESIRKKKADEEEKRRRREKRRRERREYEEESERHRKKRKKYRSSDENGESDIDGSKKKKRKKDKKHSSKTKKKRREIEEEEKPSIDLTNTLKELRSASPTKDLEFDIEAMRPESSEEDGETKVKKKKDREYSEGEWSSDSEEDSLSAASKID